MALHADKSKASVETGGRTASRIQARAKYAVPVAASCLGLLVVALLMMPMLKMEPRNVPVAILSLDEGVTVDGTYVNAGDLLLENLTGEEYAQAGQELPEGFSLFGGAGDADAATSGGDAGDAAGGDDAAADSSGSGYVSSDAVAWTVVETEEELDELFSSGECYAALTVPSGFSEHIVANAGRTALGAQLVERLPELSEGAVALESGASALASGAETLASGVSNLAGGVGTLDDGVAALPSAASSAEQGAVALDEGLSKLSALSSGIESGASG